MKIIYDDITMNRALIRIAHEIIERNKGVEDVVLLGIKTRGIYLAERLQHLLFKFENIKVDTSYLDISTYRDDVVKNNRTVNNQVNFSIHNKKVILVDDVIYHGRTIRAALDAITDLGRPKEVQLVVMIDRGHRELPIRADYVGKNVPTSTSEKVKVQLKELDGKDQVVIINDSEEKR